MRGPWSITYGWCTTGWAWCATDVMIAHPQWLTLSTTMAGRTVANLGKEISMSQPHWSNHQRKPNHQNWGLNKEVRMEWSTPGCPIGNTTTHCYSPGGGPDDKAPPVNLPTPSPIPPQDWTGQPPATFEDEVQSCQ